MNLSINNPERCKERMAAKPLTLEEERYVVSIISMHLRNSSIPKDHTDAGHIQRFIDRYETLRGLEETGCFGSWTSVEHSLPYDDRYVLCWVRSKENLQWSTYRIGTYQNDKFYLKGGYSYDENEITHWMNLPKPPKPI